MKLIAKAIWYFTLSVIKDSVADLALILNLCCNLASDIESQDPNKINQAAKAIGSTLIFPNANEDEVFALEWIVRREGGNSLEEI